MNKADRLLQRRWDQRGDQYQEINPVSKTRRGRITLVAPTGNMGTRLIDEERFYVRDSRTGQTILTFIWIGDRSKVIHGARHAYVEMGVWEMYPGLVHDRLKPDTGECLAAWFRGEFAPLLAPGQRWKTIEACLKLIECPTCQAWTGGGICFTCAMDGTVHIMGRLRDGD